MRRTFGLLAIAVMGMIVLSWNIANTKAAEEPTVYSTSSIKFDFAKHRLEWEMLRAAKPAGSNERIDSFYIDLDRGRMGHDGQEKKISENLWLSLSKIFHALDGLAIRHTSTWLGQEEPENQATSKKTEI